MIVDVEVVLMTAVIHAGDHDRIVVIKIHYIVALVVVKIVIAAGFDGGVCVQVANIICVFIVFHKGRVIHDEEAEVVDGHWVGGVIIDFNADDRLLVAVALEQKSRIIEGLIGGEGVIALAETAIDVLTSDLAVGSDFVVILDADVGDLGVLPVSGARAFDSLNLLVCAGGAQLAVDLVALGALDLIPLDDYAGGRIGQGCDGGLPRLGGSSGGRRCAD